jgi:deoxyribose-phosphate aldolase
MIEYEKMIKTIEYHLLAKDITESSTIEGCKQAVSHNIPVVCVKPCYVHQSINILRRSNTIGATVIGYPFGNAPTLIKAAETKLALTEGVLELNVVANTTYLLEGKDELFQKDLESICCLARMNGAVINVIIDSQLLSEVLIEKAAHVAIKIGAIWISPSTGLNKLNDENYLPAIKRAGEGKIKLKTMDSAENYSDWLRKFNLGFDRIGTGDLLTLLKSFKPMQ